MSKWIYVFLILALTGCATNGKVEPGSENSAELPNNDALLHTAAIAYQDKNWADSYRQYRQLIEASATDSDTWFRLGVSAYRLDKLKEAEYAFEQVVRKEPRHRKALFNLSLLSLGKGTQYLDQYLKVTPPDQREPALEKTLHDLQTLGW
ncbi:tetratricopeptide repeat protein [Amphritea balenae]|nr:tetratricopeptide repeat protein [Amphritea balenae]